MRVLHTGTLVSSAGGPAMSTYFTLKGLRDAGIDAQIIQSPIGEEDVLRGNDVPVHFSKSPWERKLCYIPSLKNDIMRLGNYDVYHAQGIWQWQTYALVGAARKVGKPYLITPRGMLYPQDIAKSNAWFKKMSLRIRLLRDLNRAACVHVTCTEELLHCRNLGVTAPIAVIPNPVEIKDYPYVKQDDIFRLGYLGRLSPRKNVEGLIRAFAQLGEKASGAELLIIGGGDRDYEQYLKDEVKRLSLNNVRFAGFLNGNEKDEALASCSVLAMPSEFENLGNVILEGLVRQIPCIATKGAPWSELNTRNCGWQVEYSQDAITNAIILAMNTNKEGLLKMGENGRRLMEERYSVKAVGDCFIRLYEWILGKSDKPDYVYVSGISPM